MQSSGGEAIARWHDEKGGKLQERKNLKAKRIATSSTSSTYRRLSGGESGSLMGGGPGSDGATDRGQEDGKDALDMHG